ncbi:MAG: hypothetical protein KHY27_06375, partial [Butyricicoccus pullicaecorum]|nr:hypothetical protein [Butyricicoccus pullicaecorum]
ILNKKQRRSLCKTPISRQMSARITIFKPKIIIYFEKDCFYNGIRKHAQRQVYAERICPDVREHTGVKTQSRRGHAEET